MFGIGGQELFVILIIALIVIGPKNLPGIARTLGRAFGQFQRAADDLKREIDISAAATAKKPEGEPSNDKAVAGNAPDDPSSQPGKNP
jgi:sec-independent protein translocase protein TatB